MLHKLRAALFVPDRHKLTSDCADQRHTDHWVEVDEVLVGGKEQGVEHRGGGAETKTLVAWLPLPWKFMAGVACRMIEPPEAAGVVPVAPETRERAGAGSA